MAYGDTFHPAGIARDVKVRGPVWVGVFSLVTFGIYALYWLIVTAKDLSEYGEAKGRDLGQNPTNTILAYVIGWIIIVPPIVALIREAKRIQQAQQMSGVQPFNGWLALVLYLVLSPVFFAYEQSELNKAWGAEGAPVPVPEGAAPGGELPAAPQQPMAASTTSSEVPASPERPGA